uniref:Uncharacterized protein n=1 Tax=Arundo donax TaxID=35708 RepID=A0A0A9F7Q1_ARUDO
MGRSNFLFGWRGGDGWDENTTTTTKPFSPK